MPAPRKSNACNECRRRKVRCPGYQPCQQCRKHSLSCTYPDAAAVAAGRSRLGAAGWGTRIWKAPERHRKNVSSSASPSITVSPGLDTRPETTTPTHGFEFEIFYDMVPEFMENLYPVCPILEEQEIRAHIGQMHVDHDAAAFVYAFAGVGFFTRQLSKPWEPGCYRQTAEMAALALDHHGSLKAGFGPSLTRILGCIFIQICMMATHRLDLAFFYLREAISLMLMRGLDDFLGARAIDPAEYARRERIYWVCFIHERFLSIASLTAVCLDPLPSLPDVTGSPQNSVNRGWNHIIQTYLCVDKDFVEFWRGDRSMVTAKWIQDKHEQLADPSWEFEITQLSPIQQADLIVSRQWLRTMTWQMAMSNMLLSSRAGQPEGLSLFMPLRLSKQLKACLTRLSHHNIVIYNVGLVPKLFEITTTVADVVLALPPGDCAEEIRSSIQDLLLTKQFLLDWVHVKPAHRNILQEKMRDIINRLYGDPRVDDLLLGASSRDAPDLAL